MSILYYVGILIFGLGIRIFSLWNSKAGEWVSGRKDLLKGIQGDLEGKTNKRFWFHASSLGEYELAKPLISGIKSKFPESLIIVTFFSPSAFEGKDSRNVGDLFYYLPLDTPRNAKYLIGAIDPQMAFFARSDLWYFILRELENRKIKTVLFSAFFRIDQFFFKSWGKFMRIRLMNFSKIFVIGEESRKILQDHGISSIVSGDARFDRVAEIVAADRKFPEIEKFVGDQKVFMAGSPWPSDMVHLGPALKNLHDHRFIIAPHDISASSLAYFQKQFNGECILYSQLIQKDAEGRRVLIIDNIGMLSSLYRFATLAYVGGGFKEGLHNVLEPAAWGLPVIFGPEIHKFPEARGLIQSGGGFVVENSQELENTFDLLSDPEKLRAAGENSHAYIQKGKGSVELILNSSGLF